ncbi:MAG: hypothetical protein CMD16_03890 [Flavobacteriales bacterium]|nr:hypothetical protein [Flavobacteriales bacterium]|tara:strand:+ start:25863 stop:27104 length:1242 start_codon:yes stop_codon:yes gene_type:complete
MKNIILILCTPLLLLSQEEIENNRTFNNQLQWNTNLLFESNGLNKKFLNSMLYGGFITDSMKSNWINTGDANNVLYSEVSNGLSYTNTKYNIGFSIADRNILNMSFSDDLMRLSFFGNFNYQNETLDFSNTNIRIDRFQQYKLNYTLNFTKAKVTVGGSFLAGNHHASFFVNDGSLFTASNGVKLDISYDINALATDTSSFNPLARNGNGMALDISLDFMIKDYNVNMYLEDLGFIMWNTKSIILNTDSSFSFTGIEINDILSFNDSLIEDYNSVDDLETENKSFKTYIPANFGFALTTASSLEHFKTISAGINIKWQPYYDNSPLTFSKIEQGIKESNYSPLYWISASSQLKYFDILPTLSYGGYSNDFNLGLALSKGYKNKLILGTQHLEDALSGETAKAISIYLNLLLQF